MKKILLILMVAFISVATNQVNAQSCDLTISNTVIKSSEGFPPFVVSPTLTRYQFDAAFDILTNNGFKTLFFHSFLEADYPVPAVFPAGGSGGTVTPYGVSRLGATVDEAGKSFLDIGFRAFPTLVDGVETDLTLNVATSFDNVDGAVALTTPGNSPGLTVKVTKTGNKLHFNITNIRVFVNLPLATTFKVKTDIWGSNANNASKAQCWIGGLTQSFNNPSAIVTKFCSVSPFQYQVSISSPVSPTPFKVRFRLYADSDFDGVQDTDSLSAGHDSLILRSDSITFGGPVVVNYSTGTLQLPWPYCCVGPWSAMGIYVTVASNSFSNVLGTNIAETGCITLPIKLSSFDANRNKSNVDLKWITEIETNNKGFYIERMLSNGGWQQITFVASQASNGNSNSPLTYTLTDFNNTKGISQYRLRQVDIDGKQSYSQIRSVRGEGQKSNTIIYPNPSGDGKVNIVFEGTNTTRDVSLMDVSGKTLKQWKGVTNNNIHIDNLNAGFYTVRIVNAETGEQTVEKFIVNKR
jgi:hypothetical protein